MTPSDSPTSPATEPSLTPGPPVERWPSELPLLVLVALTSAGIWVLLAISLLGLAYALLLGVFFFFAHVGFVASLRGSAVRLGPAQFPELYGRVEELARRAGLATTPEAYLLQADGSLNAFATRFLRSRMLVLFTDLLDACGDDRAARDMVIGHELGHLKARHLDFHFFLLPGMLVPFLGAAYSRARELTCDRFGAALCGDAAAATRGLAILAAGGRLGPQVNLQAYVAQRADLDTGWMTLGRWLSTYPPLAARVEAIRPELGAAIPRSGRGPARAGAIVLVLALLPALALGFGGFYFLRQLRSAIADPPSAKRAAGGAAAPGLAMSADERRIAIARVESDLASLEAVLREEWAARRALPADDEELAGAWAARRPQTELPQDPFAGQPYRYLVEESGSALLYSTGPDGETATDDDIDRPVALEADPAPGTS